MPDFMPDSHNPVKPVYSRTVVGPRRKLVHPLRMRNVRALRKARGLNQTELAEAVGCNQATISKIENGDANPTLDLIERIADTLNVPPFMLFDLPDLQQRALNALASIPADRRAAALVVLETMAKR